MTRLLIIASFLFGTLGLVAPSSSAQSAQIFVVNSYDMGFPWSQECLLGLVRGLEDKHVLSVFDLNTKKIPESSFGPQAERALNKILMDKPNIVVLMDDNALSLLGKILSENNIRTVFLGINSNPRDAFGGIVPDTTWGILERPLVQRSASLLPRLLPSVKRALLLGDKTETSRLIAESAFRGRPTMSTDDIVLNAKLTGSWEEWQSLVQRARENGYDALILGTHASLRDIADNVVDSNESLRWTSANSPVPVFTLWRFAVGPDMAIGGLVLSGEDQGLAAAKLVDALLTIKRPEAPHISTPTKGRFVFSAHQLERWNIILPPDIAENAEIRR